MNRMKNNKSFDEIIKELDTASNKDVVLNEDE